MEIVKKINVSFLIVSSLIFCFSMLPLQAGVPVGIPSLLVEPNGVEIPVLVNVLGQKEPNDINDVRELITEANSILEQANVQLAIERINTDINDIGNGDAVLTEDEITVALLGSLFEMQGYHWPGKGIKINIADDVRAEMPELIFWYDNFYPVAFLESGQSTAQMGITLAREVGKAAGLPESPDPNNLMNPAENGIQLNEDQTAAILAIAKEVGFVRSSLANGYSPDILYELRHKKPGALFYPEGWTLKGDFPADVTSDNLPFIGGPDLAAFIAKSGGIDVDSANRSLILKYYFYGASLPENTSLDTYFRMYNHNLDGNGSNGTQGDPFDIYDSVIGIGLSNFSSAYLGVINLRTIEKEFVYIPEAVVTTEYDTIFSRTKVKAEVPFSSLQGKISTDVMDGLINGRKLEILTKSYSSTYDPEQGFVPQEDYIENIKLEAKPGTIPRVFASFALDEKEVDSMPGFHIRSVKPVEPPDPNQSLIEFFEMLFTDSVPIAEEGSRDSEFVNLNASVDYGGFFTADNNYPDEPFPIGASNNFGTEVTAAVYLTKGLHIIGTPGKGAASLEIGGTEVGFAYYRSYNDFNDVNSVDPNSWKHDHNTDGDYNGNYMHILTQQDRPFYVEEDGFFSLRLRTWFNTERVSLELTEILKNEDGDRVLLGDVEKNSSPVLLPTNINF